MSFVEKLYLPKKLLIAGLVMIATLAIAILVQYYTTLETARVVKSVFYYLVLDYIWASVRREFFPS